MTRGECIRAAREKAGLSRRELAKRCGISHCTIVCLEKDKREGRIDTAEYIADALGISIDELIGHKVIEGGYKCTEEKYTWQTLE